MTPRQSPPRLFPLDFEGEDGLYTGSQDDGTQVLMGTFLPHLVVYFFEPGGALKGGRRQLLRQLPPRHPSSGRYLFSEPAFTQLREQQVAEWKEELLFTQGLIRVERFFDEEYGVGIEELPGYLQDLEQADPDEREELQEDREDWFKWGLFVLYWGKDYFMNAEGTVDST